MMDRPRFAFLAFSLAGFASAPAHADFYKLDGRFQCLAHTNAICFDATPSLAAPGAKPALTETPAPAAPAPTATLPEAATKPPPAPGDPIPTISARIKAKRPAPGDLDTLRLHVGEGDKRALELLAWCTFQGIGTSRDPLGAYRLYGAAAEGSVPHARENQQIIYERDLSPDQRQQLLMLEATGNKTGLP